MLTYIIIVLFFVAAVVFVLIKGSAMQQINNPVETAGVVTDIIENKRNVAQSILQGGDSKTHVKYHPVVRFQLQGSKGVKFRSRKGFDQDQFKKGDQVTVIYDATNPLNAKIKS